MTYEGTHFNDKVVMSMTRKQWLMVGGIGNKLSVEKLGEVYDLITASQPKKKINTNADNSKYAKGITDPGPAQ